MLRTVWTLLKRFFSKYFTLSIWRWGIQAIVCALITSLLVVVPQLNTLFHGTGYWAVSSAVVRCRNVTRNQSKNMKLNTAPVQVVLEGTTGGSVKKCIERMGGTFVGGIAAWYFLYMYIYILMLHYIFLFITGDCSLWLHGMKH